jgi:2-polyprenyl-6-methoxyphenol hydroxylase-like FAD-dependent oxidoreductase
MSTTHQAIIIGGGIAGTAMAIFLHKIGWASTIYEAYPQRDDIGGGLQIAPNGMRILEELGVAEQIIAKGSIASEMRFRNQQGKVLARINKNMKEKYDQPAVNVLRSALHKILVDEAHRQGIEIKYGKRLVRLTDQGNEQVTAHYEDGTEAQGDLLIGADGIHSCTRKAILPNGPHPEYTGLQWIAGFSAQSSVPSVDLSDRVLHMVFGQKGFFGYGNFCKQEGTIGWWVNLSREKEWTREEMSSVSTEQLRAELLDLCQGWNGPMQALIANTPTFMKGNVHDIQTLPVWCKGRVSLIGDAAHAVSPNSGQGASLALEDAMCLAGLLRRFPGQWRQAFDQFERDRRPRVEKIIDQGRRAGAHKQEITPFAAWIRDRMLSVVLPLFAERGNHWVYRHKIKWEAESR